MSGVVIVGAGGHAKVVCDVLLASGMQASALAEFLSSLLSPPISF